MVAIALADMHDCGPKKKELKRFKGTAVSQNAAKPIITLQPRSAFNIFLESFMEFNKNGSFIDIDRKGFQTWKNMCKEERKPYLTQAEKVNSAYMKDVIEEEKNIIKVEDEADSATVGKFDQFYETSDDYEPYHSGGFKSLNTSEWKPPLVTECKELAVFIQPFCSMSMGPYRLIHFYWSIFLFYNIPLEGYLCHTIQTSAVGYKFGFFLKPKPYLAFKCGDIDGARKHFNMMPVKNVVTWNEMIHGYAQNGIGDLFVSMKTLLHQSEHGVDPALDQYTCIIDCLGRAGHFQDVELLMEKMPYKDDPVVWEVVLSCCRVHGNVSLAERAAVELFRLDPESFTPYVLLANIYSSLGRWDDARAIRV
ncbi:hypothetical protein V6N13_131054 [Hibiscus sabdariffa]